jgi:hypothetical protein
LNGKLIYEEIIHNGKIDIHELNDGIYTIKIKDKKGVYSIKFIKQ